MTSRREIATTLHVNGAEHEVADAWLGESLLYVLRERLGLPGAKNACEQGECGSCSVLRRRRAGVLVPGAGRRRGRTARSSPSRALGADDGALTDVQQAFVDAGAVQCGFCTPGLVMAVHDLLDRQPDARPTSSPRGDLRQPLPLHRLRPDPRGRRGSPSDAPATASVDMTDVRRPAAHPAPARGIGDERRPGPTASPRCRAGSRFASDLWADGMLWGAHAAVAASVSPHPRRSTSAPALAHRRRARGAHRRRRARRDPPTASSTADQPVFADDVVRYVGEPVAVVAADHPETARRRVRRDRRRLRGARAARRPRGRRRRAADPPRRQRVPPPA